MSNTKVMTDLYTESPSPVEELEAGFDDWAEWLRSILPTLGSRSTPQDALPQGDHGKEPPDESNAESLEEAEARWQDDGGESAETV